VGFFISATEQRYTAVATIGIAHHRTHPTPPHTTYSPTPEDFPCNRPPISVSWAGQSMARLGRKSGVVAGRRNGWGNNSISERGNMRHKSAFETVARVVTFALALCVHGVATAQVCESTGFEPQEATCSWEPGFICGSGFDGLCVEPAAGVCTGDNTTDQNCCADNPNPLNGWYISSGSSHCKEPHIETANPATGTHHLRFDRDETVGDPPGCTGFTAACRQSAFTPKVGPQPIGRTVISFDIAMGDPTPGVAPFGSSGQFFTIADNEPGNGIVVGFDKLGVIYMYDGSFAYQGIGFLTGNGVYDHFEIDMDPCNNLVTYTLSDAGGAVTGVGAHDFTNLNLNRTVQRAIINTDNADFFWDFDNYSVERGALCVLGSCCDTTPGGGAPCWTSSYNLCGNEFWEWMPSTSCDEIVCQEATGACCDTSPGGGAACTDDVLIADCGGEFQEWTVSALCSDIVCQEVTGACCDRTPGEGTCADGLVATECADIDDVWTVNAICTDVTCDEIQGACCDNFSGNCFVSTIGNCTGSEATWTEGVTCAEAECTAATGACCDTGSNDPTVATCTTTTLAACDCAKCTWTRDADCSDVLCDANFQVIPAVSEWGLAILALTLLVCAKVGAYRTNARRA
jgi:hypothetical protein